MKFYQKITSDTGIRPSIIYLVMAHHPPCQLNRTWRFTIFQHRFYFCTRCLGQYTGTILALCVVLGGIFTVDNLWTQIVIFALLPFPATLDWVTQTVGWRESINTIRVFTGFLYGLSVGTSLACALMLNFRALVVVVPVYAVYLAAVMLLLARLNVLRDYLVPYKDFLSNT